MTSGASLSRKCLAARTPPLTNPAPQSPFHVAFAVPDIAEARRFYGEVLGYPEDRSADDWSTSISSVTRSSRISHPTRPGIVQRNAVDSHGVTVRHFGIVLPMAEWQAMAERLKAQDVTFVIEPYIRFRGKPGERATMFFLDPSGNALEIRAFADITELSTATRRRRGITRSRESGKQAKWMPTSLTATRDPRTTARLACPGATRAHCVTSNDARLTLRAIATRRSSIDARPGGSVDE